MNGVSYLTMFLEPVKPWLDDPAVSEIMINGPENVFIERAGRLTKADMRFESRKQLENRENAMRLLRSQLYDRALQKKRAAQAKIEAGKKKIEWGSQIRSYVFDDRRVKDHRTGYQTSDVGGVMDGKIDGFIKAYLMEFSEKGEAE